MKRFFLIEEIEKKKKIKEEKEEEEWEMIINLHSMQPNGRPHALVRHPVSSIVPKAASENQEKRILQIRGKI